MGVINSKVFAERLKQVMKEQNLRQIDVLKKCDYINQKKYNGKIKITKSSLSQWLSGYSVPSTKKLFLLSDALDVSHLWLEGSDYFPKNPRFLDLHTQLQSAVEEAEEISKEFDELHNLINLKEKALEENDANKIKELDNKINKLYNSYSKEKIKEYFESTEKLYKIIKELDKIEKEDK